jgi:hypothetical protein
LAPFELAREAVVYTAVDKILVEGVFEEPPDI